MKRLRGSPSFYGVVAALLLVVFVAAALFFARAIRVEEQEHLAQNDAIARSVAASIEAREQGYLNVLRSYAGRFRFRESIKRRDRTEALTHLRQLHQSFPDLDRVFLADPAGTVWASEPESPENYGQSYASRDWYRGVSRSWQPYMSEIYETAHERKPAVALAIPIRDVDGQVIGIITSVQNLDTLRTWLAPIQIPGGDLFVVDRKGQLVFHRTRAGADHLADYVHIPVVRRLLEGHDGVAELENPVDGEVSLSASRWVPALGWGVVVHRSKNVVLQRTRTLILAAAAVAVVLAATLVGLGGLALRNERRAAAALATSNERLNLLHEIDLALIAGETPVTIAEAALPRLRDLLGVPRDGLRGTVLYIEDNLSNLRLLERILARRPGVTLLSAMQGSRGIELARDHQPDLIILDLHLPDLSGSDVLARLCTDPRTKHIPVVILSADATPGRIKRLLEQGARDYLTKPLDVRQVLTLVDETLADVEA